LDRRSDAIAIHGDYHELSCRTHTPVSRQQVLTLHLDHDAERRSADDIVLLARTRWQLRRAIAALHEEIATLGLHLHRIKRFIGRTTQGFDFLGDQIRAGARLRPSAEGLRRLRERARQLYEREGDWQRLRQYVVRWQRWHLGGLDEMVRRKGGVKRTWHHVLTHLAEKHPPG